MPGINNLYGIYRPKSINDGMTSRETFSSIAGGWLESTQHDEARS